jgi:hypothetical protein
MWLPAAIRRLPHQPAVTETDALLHQLLMKRLLVIIQHCLEAVAKGSDHLDA